MIAIPNFIPPFSKKVNSGSATANSNASISITNDNRLPTNHPEQDYFNGAAIIDENGAETPITEKMIQEALNQLEHLNHYRSISGLSNK